MQCHSCGAIFTEGEAERGAEALYEHYHDGASFEIPPTVARSLESLVLSTGTFRKSGRWLDIGYGEGGLLEVAEKHGWSCYGTEISPRVLEHGRRRGWVVGSAAESDPRFPEAGFDVVTMIEFLEHVPQPAQFVRAAARWLRPGGLLYLTTPNASSLNRHLLGLAWSVFSPAEHLTLWTARGIEAVFRDAGFAVARLRTEGFNPVEILARLRSGRRPAPPVHRDRSARALSEALSRSRPRRALKKAVNEGLNALGMGDTLKVWGLRGG